MRITAFTILLIAFIIVYKDLEKLGMWEPLQDLLASSSDNMKVQVLWVIGTAVQNNPAAQKSVRSTPSRGAPKSTAKTRLRLCTDHGSQYLALNPLPTILSYLSPLAPSSQQLRSKAIYTLSGVLNHNAAAITLFETSGGWDTLRDAFSGTDRIHPPTHTLRSRPHSLIICCASDSDIVVRRKAAFLLNSLLTPSGPASSTTTTSSSGTRLHGGPPQQAGGAAPVHPNSHASMVADPTQADTATATLRALRAHGLVPVLVRELTEPTPYGPDGDEGDGCDADLEDKLIRCVRQFTMYGCMYA